MIFPKNIFDFAIVITKKKYMERIKKAKLIPQVFEYIKRLIWFFLSSEIFTGDFHVIPLFLTLLTGSRKIDP